MSGTSQIDPRTAIQAYLATLTDAQKLLAEKELGISLDAIPLMNYEAARKFCENHNINIGVTNVWAKYDNAKLNFENYYQAYQQANGVYLKLKAETDRARKRYEVKYNEALAHNGGKPLSGAEISRLRAETKYTTVAIKSVHDAELTASLLLDKMGGAVDEQRAGLAFGTVAEGMLNIKA